MTFSGMCGALFRVERQCRACGGESLEQILDLGESPIADRLVDPDSAPTIDPRIPLRLSLCRDCALLQIRETVDRRMLFGDDYPYFSSTSSSWVAHCRDNARALIRRFGLGASSLVVEPASNDGYMLRHFRDEGIPVLGIEPAAAPARAAVAAGIATEQKFLDTPLARELAARGRRADLLIANNVLAHADDLHDFLTAVTVLLKDGGVLVAEVPYAADLVRTGAFDTVYHQHLCYFAMAPLAAVARRHGLEVFDVQRLDTQGGSIRVFFAAGRPAARAVAEMLDAESRAGMDAPDHYRAFTARVALLKTRLVARLLAARQHGERVAAYGAAAKATTLLHYCGIDSRLVDYIVDGNAFKQGKWMPGCRLPIHAPDRLRTDPPDVLLLLAWNLKQEILSGQGDFLASGGRVIVPLPEFEIVGGRP